MYLEESIVKSIGLNTYNDDILSFLDSKIQRNSKIKSF